ncbi:Potassium/sodium hyperpolarization-activated cyclic nucleotide-gated channel 4 [Phytophthora cinnamomi]|uniref:Potassium/sodium hyperpolarization-activated cyclic nucleotide-gated channel 4 n=1 Tax=Phytophthora cinnamomi TaxID=4785 RepID=UPI003559DA60|nr:Potassium/sodium hyperpolarization-activated cyclic nucleotide-gated channel 4 [Phytophthora cinnamomi]
MAAKDAAQTPDVDYVLVDFEPLHKQRWRSETVRLVCVQFPPHTQSLWHKHLNYGIYVVMAPLSVTEQPHGQEPRPLVQAKGSVFCRDHTKDKLLHIITSHDAPLFIVEVELLKKKEDVAVHDHVALHAAAGVELLNDEPECRVYRLTLGDEEAQSTTEISLNLPTGAVLVVLDDCEVEVTNASEDSTTVEAERKLSLKVADDIQLSAGKFSIKLASSSAKKTQFILAEVY